MCRCHSSCRSAVAAVPLQIGSNPIFAVPAVAGQPISVRVTVTRMLIGCDTSCHCLPIRKDVSSNSILMHNGNGSYGTELRQRYNGMSQQHNGMAKRQWQNGNGKLETRRKCTTLKAPFHYRRQITYTLEVIPECHVTQFLLFWNGQVYGFNHTYKVFQENFTTAMQYIVTTRVRTIPKKLPNIQYPIVLDTMDTNTQYQYRY